MSGELPIGPEFDLAAFERGFEQIADSADKAFKRVADSAEREFRKVDAQIPKVTKSSEDASRSLDKLGGIAEKAGAKLGGVFGEAADLVFDFIAPLGEAAEGLGTLGTAGLAAGGAVVALAGGTALAVGAAKQLADAAVEAAKRLEEQGLAARIPDEAAESLRTYTDASGNLSAQLDVLTVQLGSTFADDLAVLATEFGGVVDRVTELTSGLGDLARSALYVVSLSTSEYLFEWRDAEYEAALAAADHEAALRELAAAEKAGEDEAQRYIDSQANKVKASKKSTDATKAEEAALRDMLATAKQVAAEANLLAADQAARAQAEIDRSAAVTEAVVDDLAKIEERTKALKAVELDLASALISSSQSIAGAYVASMQRRAAAGEHMSEAEKQAAERAFAIAQGLQLASAELAAITTGANTVEQLTSVGVPFPVALGLGAAAVATMMAGAVAQIAQAQPPEFPGGRTPDHTVTARLRRDEGVLSPSATRALGGPDAVRDLNSGRGLGGGDVELGPRTLRALDGMLRGTRRPGVVSTAAGRTPVHGR